MALKRPGSLVHPSSEELVSGLDEATFAKRIKPDQWSLKELVCHLDRVQQIFGGRFRR